MPGRTGATALGREDIRFLHLSLMSRSQQKVLLLLLLLPPPAVHKLVPMWMLKATLRHLERWLPGLPPFLSK